MMAQVSVMTVLSQGFSMHLSHAGTNLNTAAHAPPLERLLWTGLKQPPEGENHRYAASPWDLGRVDAVERRAGPFDARREEAEVRPVSAARACRGHTAR